MPELIEPTGRLHAAWIEAHAEWGPGVHEDGFGLLPTDDVGSTAGFAAWVERLAGESERCTYRWIVEDGQVLGGIALRHEGHHLAPRAGHIGYGIRPTGRRRGLATWALGRMVREAEVRGMERLLVVCKAGNAASARTIERHGGILEDDAGNGAVLRYWIRTDRLQDLR
ncbi:acetyltransferase [Arthrobacter sp. NicSoilB4]|uniref:GNAT family N-acetyltransferase n=1 Tax=Arthrobacter sp. NicSoilB4 TaxID=2830997 RepID=UPI001CC471B5|nr:GNAT family N-acetyltransferase [Arthrobacter sp. NicSoilB4]BCW67256.1 acetyltransferase [Arthrobacter sp. NicSoilB4]